LKFEHLAAEDMFSSDALLAGVDEAGIKEDIKVGSDVNDQSCLKKDFKERLASDQDDDQGDDQRMRDNLMGKSILPPGVKSHNGEEKEDDLDPHAEQIFRMDVLLAGVDDSGSDESAEEEDEEVAPVKEIALTPGVESEDPEPGETHNQPGKRTSRRDFRPMNVLDPFDDFKSESKSCASTNHIGSHKAEALKEMGKARVALKDMGKARVATGRISLLSASVKKLDKKSGKTISRSLVDMLLQIDPQLYTPCVTEENGMPVVYMEILMALYGMIKSPLLIYRKLRKDFEQNEFTVIPRMIFVWPRRRLAGANLKRCRP
jgi:hypothetical protein